MSRLFSVPPMKSASDMSNSATGHAVLILNGANRVNTKAVQDCGCTIVSSVTGRGCDSI